MGIKRKYLDYIDECVRATIGSLSGKRMLELGDQEVGALEKDIVERTGKEYFQNRGVLHVSVDLNGLHGAVKADLSKPFTNEGWRGYFDIVTNLGTSEHVEPYEAQYECFMNVHNCLKKGGIAIHFLPAVEELSVSKRWNGHCNNYYSREFFKRLADNNGYKIVSSGILNELLCVCLQKESDTSFMEDRKEFLRYITRKKGGVVYAGINDHGLSRLLRIMAKPLLDATRPIRNSLRMSFRKLLVK